MWGRDFWNALAGALKFQSLKRQRGVNMETAYVRTTRSLALGALIMTEIGHFWSSLR